MAPAQTIYGFAGRPVQGFLSLRFEMMGIALKTPNRRLLSQIRSFNKDVKQLELCLDFRKSVEIFMARQ